MPTFDYIARVSPSETESGSISAASADAAVERLRRRDRYVVSLRSAEHTPRRVWTLSRRPGASTQAAVARHLADLLQGDHVGLEQVCQGRFVVHLLIVFPKIYIHHPELDRSSLGAILSNCLFPHSKKEEVS